MMVIKKVRATWCRLENGVYKISHPTVFIVTDEAGYERSFDRKRDAMAWIANRPSQ